MAAPRDGPFRGEESLPIDLLLEVLGRQNKLSRRERDVAAGGARGLDTKATAAVLRVSPKTVDELWRRIYRKFNCRSRIEVLSRLLAEALGRAKEGSSSLRRKTVKGSPRASGARTRQN